jgi:hypothetical protein
MGHIFAFALGVVAIFISVAVLLIWAVQLVIDLITWAVSL